MKRIPIESYTEAVKALIYDPASASALRWATGREAGKEAGAQDHNNYWLVRVGSRPGRLFKAHRLVWFMHHQTMPNLIDHRDRNPANNIVSNLREATESQNRTNSRKHSDNTSGAKGVCWDAKNKKWQVSVHHNYKHHFGGRFTELSDAIHVATVMREQLHKGFANHD